MRLSEAIMLGDTLKTGMDIYLSSDGSCGCALGGAVLAVGKQEQFQEESLRLTASWCATHGLQSIWPWITDDVVVRASEMYRGVLRGVRTIEEIADYVRSVEPAEDVPAYGTRYDQGFLGVFNGRALAKGVK